MREFVVCRKGDIRSTHSFKERLSQQHWRNDFFVSSFFFFEVLVIPFVVLPHTSMSKIY